MPSRPPRGDPPSLEKVRRLFFYDPESGAFTRLVNSGRARAGESPGYIDAQGYLVICVECHAYRAHRLAWFYMTGRWPGILDHIDRVRHNNRWANLREVTARENAQNTVRCERIPTGTEGAYPRGHRWWSQINTPSGIVYLGMFDTMAEAHAAWREARSRAMDGGMKSG